MNKLVQAIARLSMLMESTEEEAKNKFDLKDLTLTQMNYLEMISHLGHPNLTELALSLKLSKPTVTVAVGKLIKSNLVRKERSIDDRRNSRLYLTERGQLINKMHSYAHQKMAKFISGRLERNEIEFLIQIFNKVMS